jgi:predicted deacylase
MKRPARNYLKLLNELINIQSPFDTEILGMLNYDQSYPFIGLHSHSKLAKWNVVINAGAHGEETIGIRVMLRFINEFNRDFLGYYNFMLFPVVNPHGYAYARRRNGAKQYVNGNCYTVETPSIIVPEFQYMKEKIPQKVDLFIDIHADVDKQGFYIYERKRPEVKSLAELALKDIHKEKYPVETTDTIYQEKCVNGVIVQPIKDNSMDDFMFKKGAIYSLCLEIPGKAPEEQQVIGALHIINSVLKNYKEFVK